MTIQSSQISKIEQLSAPGPPKAKHYVSIRNQQIYTIQREGKKKNNTRAHLSYLN